MDRALRRFSSWLDAVSPRHRALRTPVYLEPEAPPLVRAFWDHVGWSDVTAPLGESQPTRPERVFADRHAMKIIQGWFSSPRVRERWGVSSPGDVEAAVRSRIPARSRFVWAGPRAANLTDETSDADDPPLLRLDEDGGVKPSWPSYVERLVWQICQNVGWRRGRELPVPVPAAPEHERPFAPALDAFWTLGEGVWAVGPSPLPSGGDAPRDVWASILYQSPAHYFAYVKGLPDGEIERHFVNDAYMHSFGVTDAKGLDPEHLSVPGFRPFIAPAAFGESLFRGLVELEGARLWLEKRQNTTGTFVLAEPEQAAVVKALIKREKLRVYEQTKPKKDPLAVDPTAAEIAAAKKLHDRARAATAGESA